MTSSPCIVIGGGLAGTEAALLLARAGLGVTLCEMRPGRMTPAHTTDMLAELVCSNSLRSDDPESAVGLLKEELRALSSPVLAAADRHRLKAGKALAVDRERFAADLTAAVEAHPAIRLVREEVTRLDPDVPTILAPGPLVSDALASHLQALLRPGESLLFFDAIAPIVERDSLDMGRLFRASRYGPEGEEGDYLNAPMDRETYLAFVEALLAAERVVPHGFDADDRLPLFSGCQPIEAIAATGPLSLAHGPMRPTGLRLASGRRDLFAVVQMRAENENGTAWNLVGFQTRLRQGEQRRVFRMIPGLERAEFLRYGSLHRNSYIDSPRVLAPDLSLLAAPQVLVAGQFAGAEGYVESIALGHLAARFLAARLAGRALAPPPPETAVGALLRYVTSHPVRPLEPTHIHFGLLPPGRGRRRRDRRLFVLRSAREALAGWIRER